MRTLPVFAILALLSGCTILRIDRQPLAETPEEPAGEIRFLAVRRESPERLSNGFLLTVMKDLSIVGQFPSSAAEPTRVGDLKPGVYDISIGGPGIVTESTQVHVRSGKATVVRLMVRNARALVRCGDAAVTAGKVVLTAVGAVVVAAGYVALAILSSDCDDDDDDDDEDFTGQSPKSKERPSPRSGSVGSYRKK
jgi:hypothetical protein